MTWRETNETALEIFRSEAWCDQVEGVNNREKSIDPLAARYKSSNGLVGHAQFRGHKDTLDFFLKKKTPCAWARGARVLASYQCRENTRGWVLELNVATCFVSQAIFRFRVHSKFTGLAPLADYIKQRVLL